MSASRETGSRLSRKRKNDGNSNSQLETALHDITDDFQDMATVFRVPKKSKIEKLLAPPRPRGRPKRKLSGRASTRRSTHDDDVDFSDLSSSVNTDGESQEVLVLEGTDTLLELDESILCVNEKFCASCKHIVPAAIFSEHIKECLQKFSLSAPDSSRTAANLENEKPKAKVAASGTTAILKNEDPKEKVSAAVAEEGSHLILPCPFCFKALKSRKQRQSHIKSCGQSHGLSSEKVIQAVRLQEKEVEERKQLGLPYIVPQASTSQQKAEKATISSKPKTRATRSKKDPDLEMAIALSRSVAEEEAEKRSSREQQLLALGLDQIVEEDRKAKPVAILPPSVGAQKIVKAKEKSRGRKGRRNFRDTLLYNRSAEERDRIISEKVASILTAEDVPKTTWEEMPTKGGCGRLANFRNESCSLWDSAHSHLERPLGEFYVPDLEPYIRPKKCEVGSLLKKLSDIPGRLNVTVMQGMDENSDSGSDEESVVEGYCTQLALADLLGSQELDITRVRRSFTSLDLTAVPDLEDPPTSGPNVTVEAASGFWLVLPTENEDGDTKGGEDVENKVNGEDSCSVECLEPRNFTDSSKVQVRKESESRIDDLNGEICYRTSTGDGETGDKETDNIVVSVKNYSSDLMFNIEKETGSSITVDERNFLKSPIETESDEKHVIFGNEIQGEELLEENMSNEMNFPSEDKAKGKDPSGEDKSEGKEISGVLSSGVSPEVSEDESSDMCENKDVDCEIVCVLDTSTESNHVRRPSFSLQSNRHFQSSESEPLPKKLRKLPQQKAKPVQKNVVTELQDEDSNLSDCSNNSDKTQIFENEEGTERNTESFLDKTQIFENEERTERNTESSLDKTQIFENEEGTESSLDKTQIFENEEGIERNTENSLDKTQIFVNDEGTESNTENSHNELQVKNSKHTELENSILDNENDEKGGMKVREHCDGTSNGIEDTLNENVGKSAVTSADSSDATILFTDKRHNMDDIFVSWDDLTTNSCKDSSDSGVTLAFQSVDHYDNGNTVLHERSNDCGAAKYLGELDETVLHRNINEGEDPISHEDFSKQGCIPLSATKRKKEASSMNDFKNAEDTLNFQSGSKNKSRCRDTVSKLIDTLNEETLLHEGVSRLDDTILCQNKNTTCKETESKLNDTVLWEGEETILHDGISKGNEALSCQNGKAVGTMDDTLPWQNESVAHGAKSEESDIVVCQNDETIIYGVEGKKDETIPWQNEKSVSQKDCSNVDDTNLCQNENDSYQYLSETNNTELYQNVNDMDETIPYDGVEKANETISHQNLENGNELGICKNVSLDRSEKPVLHCTEDFVKAAKPSYVLKMKGKNASPAPGTTNARKSSIQKTNILDTPMNQINAAQIQTSSKDSDGMYAKLLYDWSSLLASGEKSDVTITVHDGDELSAHAVVILARCSQLYEEVKDIGHISWNEVSYEGAYTFLVYIYTGKCSIHTKDDPLWMDVFDLALRYNCEDLVNYLESLYKVSNSPLKSSISVHLNSNPEVILLDTEEMACINNELIASVPSTEPEISVPNDEVLVKVPNARCEVSKPGVELEGSFGKTSKNSPKMTNTELTSAVISTESKHKLKPLQTSTEVKSTLVDHNQFSFLTPKKKRSIGDSGLRVVRRHLNLSPINKSTPVHVDSMSEIPQSDSTNVREVNSSDYTGQGAKNATQNVCGSQSPDLFDSVHSMENVSYISTPMKSPLTLPRDTSLDKSSEELSTKLAAGCEEVSNCSSHSLSIPLSVQDVSENQKQQPDGRVQLSDSLSQKESNQIVNSGDRQHLDDLVEAQEGDKNCMLSNTIVSSGGEGMYSKCIKDNKNNDVDDDDDDVIDLTGGSSENSQSSFASASTRIFGHPGSPDLDTVGDEMEPLRLADSEESNKESEMEDSKESKPSTSKLEVGKGDEIEVDITCPSPESAGIHHRDMGFINVADEEPAYVSNVWDDFEDVGCEIPFDCPETPTAQGVITENDISDTLHSYRKVAENNLEHTAITKTVMNNSQGSSKSNITTPPPRLSLSEQCSRKASVSPPSLMPSTNRDSKKALPNNKDRADVSVASATVNDNHDKRGLEDNVCDALISDDTMLKMREEFDESGLWREEFEPIFENEPVADGKMSEPEGSKQYCSMKTPQPTKNTKKSITPMPDYKVMPSPELKKELEKYGIKPISRRKAVTVLEHVYEKTHPLVTDSEADSSYCDSPQQAQSSKSTHSMRGKPVSSLQRKAATKNQKNNAKGLYSKSKKEKAVQGKSSKTATTELTKICEEAQDEEDDDEEPLNSSQNSSVSSEGSELDCVEESMLLGIGDSDSAGTITQQGDLPSQVAQFITSDPELHQKVLLYEPFFVEDLQASLKANGVKCNMNNLLDILDNQCVTFRTHQGQRTRLRKRKCKRKSTGTPGKSPKKARKNS